MDKPEALLLADRLESDFIRSQTMVDAAAELRRLHPYEPAYKAWHEKTEWVQTTARPGEFGMHRADVMRQRLEQAKAQRDALLAALKAMLENSADYTATRDQARAAIAVVEGEKP